MRLPQNTRNLDKKVASQTTPETNVRGKDRYGSTAAVLSVVVARHMRRARLVESRVGVCVT